MVNLLTGEASHAFFGGEVPVLVRHLLERARGSAPNEMESLLWTAQVSAPECLAIYYLLYKFHARMRQYEQAERAASKGMLAAACQAGLPTSWQGVRPGDADFAVPGPARFWLFSLKALAFIRLRAGQVQASREIVAKLRELDPSHGLGSEVIADLLDGSANNPTPPQGA